MPKITKAEKRAYVRKLEEIERRFGKIERDTLRRSRTMLRDFRNRIAGQLTQVEDFEQFRLRELQANVDELITQYEGQLQAVSKGAVRDSINLGRSSVVEPLEAGGFESLFFGPSPAQVNVLIDFSADLITSVVGHDMRKSINNQIRMSALGGVSSFHTMKNITKTLFGDERISKPTDPAKGIAYEAERILRTETNRAYNLAASSQQADIAKQVPGLEKQWMATGDSRTRRGHLRAHGQIVPADKPFRVANKAGKIEELMYPLDPAGSASNTINCRCRSVMVIPEIGPIATPLDVEVEKEKARRDKEKVQKARPGLTAAQAEEIALMDNIKHYDPFKSIRPPVGRAPRGSGTEYAQRRRIVKRIETQIKWRDTAQIQLDKYRGQTTQRLRWRYDVAQVRVQELNRGIATMLDISNDEHGDWEFKSEIVDGITKHLSVTRVMAQ